MVRYVSTQTHDKTVWWDVLVHRHMANIMVRCVSTQTHGKTLWWDVLVHRHMAKHYGEMC